MSEFSSFIQSKRHQYGEQFSSEHLALKFVPYFNSGQRIIVKMRWGEVERGYVGVTTGWKPVFLLVHRRSDLGSSTTLDARDEIIGTVNKYLNR